MLIVFYSAEWGGIKISWMMRIRINAGPTQMTDLKQYN